MYGGDVATDLGDTGGELNLGRRGGDKEEDEEEEREEEEERKRMKGIEEKR